MVVSLIAMCSATSAIDHRSGPALNVHCASDSPENRIEERLPRLLQVFQQRVPFLLRQRLGVRGND